MTWLDYEQRRLRREKMYDRIVVVLGVVFTLALAYLVLR